MVKHLVLISGGGFSTESNSYIDDFALNLCQNKGKKNLVFIPTASYDAPNYIDKFCNNFNKHNVSYLKTADLMSTDILNNADLIYIGGGNTNHMMKTWKEIGFDKRLIELYHQGTVIVGISAGAVCWFSTIFESNKMTAGLNILAGSFCPHYDDINEDKLAYDNWANENKHLRHYKLNNNESLHVKNGNIVAKIMS